MGLPMAESSSMSRRPEGGSSLKGKRIIVIEDEPLVAMELETLLADAGCELAGSVGNLEDGKTLCAQADCDAALLDANIRGRPVDELARTLTARNIPFAFVTGYGRDALPRGFQNAVILKKPFQGDDLLAALQLLTHRTPGVIELRRK
jgi:DNA-binding NarL/FixJ family response regulator